MSKSQGGFTLIELLTVIGIIGILAGVIIVSASASRRVARDRKRVSDIELVRGAVEAYIKEYSVLIPPQPSDDISPGCPEPTWDCSLDGDFMSFLSPDYFETAPLDPSYPGTDSYYYLYFVSNNDSAITNGCQEPYYVLMAKMETDGVSAARNDQNCWTGSPVNDNVTYVVIGRY